MTRRDPVLRQAIADWVKSPRRDWGAIGGGVLGLLALLLFLGALVAATWIESNSSTQCVRAGDAITCGEVVEVDD